MHTCHFGGHSNPLIVISYTQLKGRIKLVDSGYIYQLKEPLWIVTILYSRGHTNLWIASPYPLLKGPPKIVGCEDISHI